MEKEGKAGEVTEQDPKVKKGCGPESTGHWLVSYGSDKDRHDTDVGTGNSLVLHRIDFLR